MVVTLTACGGSGGEASPGSTENVGETSLPEGFPEGVPLPEHDEISSARQLSETSWRLLLMTDPDADGSLENYAAILTDAGFEVDVSGPIVSGKSPTLNVDAVVRPPTITLQVMTRDA